MCGVLICVCVGCGCVHVWVLGFVMCGCVYVRVFWQYVYFCLLCFILFVLGFYIVSFMYIYYYLFYLYFCKDYWHRVTTQLQLLLLLVVVVVGVVVVVVVMILLLLLLLLTGTRSTLPYLYVSSLSLHHKPESRGFDSPTMPLEFFIDLVLPAALWPWGRLSL